MTVSALVLSLDPSTADRVTRALSAFPELHLGPRHGERLPVVVETQDLESGVAVARRLLDTQGVWDVHVVAIDFDDDDGHHGPGSGEKEG